MSQYVWVRKIKIEHMDPLSLPNRNFPLRPLPLNALPKSSLATWRFPLGVSCERACGCVCMRVSSKSDRVFNKKVGAYPSICRAYLRSLIKTHTRDNNTWGSCSNFALDSNVSSNGKYLTHPQKEAPKNKGKKGFFFEEYSQ